MSHENGQHDWYVMTDPNINMLNNVSISVHNTTGSVEPMDLCKEINRASI